ncbi:60S ribosomal protein L22 [Pseudoloma neurophilia]|uniref:60S ribosomal protein L22 n=1 Tax=Pseudoloma neurophilia TaxID=146866 RepID=A0A0R0LR37_9MICR|nr:60S ribosomal protein L22 [Pseudoloma neurophilia]
MERQRPGPLSFNVTDPNSTVFTKHNNLRVKYKLSVDLARNLKGRTLTNSLKYLQDIINRKDCVKMTRYAKKCGRTAQANNKLINGKKYSDNRGRWPIKPAKLFISLLNTLIKQSEEKSLDPSILKLKHINVNKAPQIQGRMQRAFGRVSASNSHPCHIEIVAQKPTLTVDDLD